MGNILGTLFMTQKSTGEHLISNEKDTNLLQNKKWILKGHPQGKFDTSRDADFIEETIDLSDIPGDKVVIEVQALSVDAFIRTMLDNSDNVAHGSSGGIGSTIPALGYGKVIKGNTKFKKGAIVTGLLGATNYAVTESTGLMPIQEGVL